jgi:hypothetical protein
MRGLGSVELARIADALGLSVGVAEPMEVVQAVEWHLLPDDYEVQPVAALHIVVGVAYPVGKEE